MTKKVRTINIDKEIKLDDLDEIELQRIEEKIKYVYTCLIIYFYLKK